VAVSGGGGACVLGAADLNADERLVGAVERTGRDRVQVAALRECVGAVGALGDLDVFPVEVAFRPDAADARVFEEAPVAARWVEPTCPR
jgi:hypothetical protein